jgi:hypothetical protein
MKTIKCQFNNQEAILLDESHKLDPRPLAEGRRPKSGKLRLNLHGIILEGKSIGSNQKKEKKEKEKRLNRLDWLNLPPTYLPTSPTYQFRHLPTSSIPFPPA